MQTQPYPKLLSRIFITTGLISLINALVIQKARGKGNDDLIIVTGSGDRHFIDDNLKIAKLGNFQNIKILTKIKELRKLNLKPYSEILTCGAVAAKPSKAALIVFDEGASYPCRGVKEFPGVSEVYVSHFLDRIDYCNLPESVKTTPIVREEFIAKMKEVQSVLQIKAVTDKKEKSVLFVSHWLWDSVGSDLMLDFCIGNINKFISNGFKVYYKPHPRNYEKISERLREHYQQKPLFTFGGSGLPAELLIDDFALIAGAFCGTLLSMPHYLGIPAAHLDLPCFYAGSSGIKLKKNSLLYECYTPPLSCYESLLSLPNEQFRSQAKFVQSKFLAITPPLQKHAILNAALEYKPKWYRDLFFGILGTFSNKSRRLELKNTSRSTFSNLTDSARQAYHEDSETIKKEIQNA